MAEKERFSRDVTVAHIREKAEHGYVEVMFLESARIYRLLVSHKSFRRLLAQLREGMKEALPVRVVLTSENGDVIQDVSKI